MSVAPRERKPEVAREVKPCVPIQSVSSAGKWVENVIMGVGAYYATTLIVGIGLLFGHDVINQQATVSNDRGDFVQSLMRFDGEHYLSIARDGYEYDPSRRSTVAFFPAYPVLGRCIAGITGVGFEVALLLTANGCLVVAFVLLACYTRARNPDASGSEVLWVIVAFGLWPTSFFYRLPYSESVFLTCTILTLYGMVREWPLLAVAVLSGLTTATRPVGVAVAAAFLWHVLRGPGRTWARLGRAVGLAPLACWGLLAYMGYLYLAFGNPLACIQTQVHWTFPAVYEAPDVATKFWSLATLEPIRGVYDPSSMRYCCGQEPNENPLFNMSFWNPVLFLVAVGLLGLGACCRWLTGPEMVMSAGLLAVPYITRAYEMSMASQGRFAAVVLSTYLVLGRLLASVPAAVAGAMVSLSAVMLALWSSLYAAGYLFF